jgi:uncharacterized protein YecA (UPF0149 family)
MKLSKSKLKQLIKEVFEEEVVAEDALRNQMEDLMYAAAKLYKSLPKEGKEHLTQNFEDYAQKWREDMQDEANRQNIEDTEYMTSLYPDEKIGI